MSSVIKNKKIIITIILILLLTFLIPLLQTIGQILFEGGKLVGSFIRTYYIKCV